MPEKARSHNELRTICDELLQLGGRSATPAARKRLEEATSSKWDGRAKYRIQAEEKAGKR